MKSITCILCLGLVMFSGVLQSQVTPQTAPFDAPEMVWPMTAADSLHPSPYYDRFGNNIPRSFIYGKGDGFKAYDDTAGHFVLLYAENKVGFNDPSKGPKRRAVLEQVLKDISALILSPPTDACTGKPQKVRLMVNSFLFSLNGSNALAAATSAFNNAHGNNMILDGEVWKVLVTGKGSENTNNHGFITVNFGYNFYTELDPQTTPIADNQYDLYTILLHEVIHTMGFHSMIDSSGVSIYSDRGKSFFSRFDQLMRVDGTPAISSSTPATPYYNLSSNLDAFTTTATCVRTAVTASGCQYLDGDVALFAPNPFQRGSSLSHFEKCLAQDDDYLMSHALNRGEMRRTPDTEVVQTLTELGFKTTGIYGSDPSIAENYRTYNGPAGQVLGGIDDGFNCDDQTVFSLATCPGNSITIDVAANDGKTPTAIEGLRILNVPSASVSVVNGNQIRYTAPTDYFVGHAIIQYVPVYGCTFGNITELHVYNTPCLTLPEYCAIASDANCQINCYGDMQQSVFGSSPNCWPLSADEQLWLDYGLLGDGITNEVVGWVSLNDKTSPDYWQFSGPQSRGIGIAAEDNRGGLTATNYTEGLVHYMPLKKGEHYLFRIRLRRLTGLDNCPKWKIQPGDDFGGDFVRIRAGSGPYIPARDNQLSFNDVDNYVVNQSGGVSEVAHDIPGDSVASGAFSWYEFCYTPDADYDYITIYAQDDDQSLFYVYFEDFQIREMPLDSFENQTIACNGMPVSLSAQNHCEQLDFLNPVWTNAFGDTLALDTTAEFSAIGDYAYNLMLGDAVCFSAPFSIVSDAGFSLTADITAASCDGGPGSIDITVVDGTPGASYTYTWEKDGSFYSASEDLTNLSAGAYTLTVEDGECSLTEVFIVPGQPVIALGIVSLSGEYALCDGSPLTLQTADNQPANWFKNGVPVSGGSNVVQITVTDTGLYHIERSPQNDTCFAPAELRVIQQDRPDISFGTYRICRGEIITIDPTVSPAGGTYTWNWPGGGSSTDSSIDVSPEQNNTYYRLTYEHSGCSVTDSVKVTLRPAPVVEKDRYSVCQGETLEIPVTVNGFGALDLATPWRLTPLDTWDQNNGLLTLQAIDSKSYTFSAEDLNGDKCLVTVEVNVKKPHEMIIPGNLQSGLTVDTGTVVRFDQTDGLIWVHGPIHVKAGARLILDNADMRFFNNFDILKETGYAHEKALSGIIVEPGGILTVENNTVMAGLDQVCPQMWEGIEVWGDDLRRYLSPAMDPVIDNNPAPGTIVIPDVMQTMDESPQIYRHGIMFVNGPTTITDAHQGISLYNRYRADNDPYEYGRGLLLMDPANLIVTEHHLRFDYCDKAIVGKGRRKIENHSIVRKTLINNTAMRKPGYITLFPEPAGPVGIELHHISELTFLGQVDISLSDQDSAVGMLIYNSAPKFEFQPGQFGAPTVTISHCQSAIEAYSAGSLADQLNLQLEISHIVNNENGVILKNLPFPVVSELKFRNNQQYDVFAEGCQGAFVGNSRFETLHNTRGVIVENSVGDTNEVYRNEFITAYRAGVQFQGKNPEAYMTCNKFKEPNIFDVAITGIGDTLGTLGDQGVCNNTDATLITANEFSSCTHSESNIFWDANADPNGFLYSSFPGLAPNCVSNTVGVISCFGVTVSQDDACPDRGGLAVPLPDDLPVDPTDLLNTAGNFNDQVRTLLASLSADSVAQLIPLTSNLRLRTYIATMLDEGRTDDAKAKMQVLKAKTGLSTDDFNFIDLFDLLIALAEQEKPWEQMNATELNKVKNIALKYGNAALAAQAVYGSVTGTRFLPAVAPLSDPPSPALKQKQDQPRVSGLDGAITMHPNPAQNELQISLLGDVALREMKIYNVLGEVVYSHNPIGKTTVFTISVDNLPGGSYLVHFTEESGKRSVQKLTIVK